MAVVVEVLRIILLPMDQRIKEAALSLVEAEEAVVVTLLVTTLRAREEKVV